MYAEECIAQAYAVARVQCSTCQDHVLLHPLCITEEGLHTYFFECKIRMEPQYAFQMGDFSWIKRGFLKEHVVYA